MKQKVVQFARLAAVLCLLLGMWGPTALAQRGISVKGRVVDADGLPVIGAGVTLKGTTTGVAADVDGGFTLLVPGETAVLEVSALGYVTEEVKVGKQRNFTVVLRDDTQSIEATVVVAYGTQTKATVTGALTSIDNKALIKAPVADVTNVLAGQMPGVSTVQETGQPGEDYAKIYIRGAGSLSDSNASPLILVDGVERPLNTVDPNEIESLSILKDAASTAVFGVRGANGVIIVTTKRGDTGKPRISVSSITGAQVPMSYITQSSSYDFARYYNVYQWNDGKTDPGLYFTPEAIEAYRTGSDPVMFPNTQWHELMFRKAFVQTKNNINISGGSDKVRYFVSMGYMFQNGLLKQIPDVPYDNNYSYNRYNYRANLDFKLTETTDMKFNISGVIGNTREPLASNRDNIWMLTMLWAHPTASPGIVNGMPVTVVSYDALPDGLTKWNGWEYYYWSGYQNKFKTTLNMDMTITQRLDFLTQGLSVSVKGSFDTSMALTKKRTGSGGYHQTIEYQSWADNSGLSMSDPAFDRTYLPVISGSEPTLSYSESTDDDKSWYLEASINYKRKFAGKHNVSALFLYNQSRNYYPKKDGEPMAYQWLPRGYVGWVARATYAYADKYLVDVSAGYNGSENFAPGKTRYGLFPSASLGWVISEEKWMKKAPWIDFLKVRASIGKVGNDLSNTVRFMYMDGVWTDAGSYYFGTGKNDGVPRYELGTPGNKGVTWETALKTNVGLDFDLLNYRLHFSGDIFYEHRTGILIAPRSLPSIIATSLPNMNLGVVDNKGFEIELGWKDHVGDFTYDISANATFARNKIIFEDEVEPEYEYQRETGGPTGRYMLYQFERLYQKSDFYTDADGVQRLNPDLPQPSNAVYPGDCMYKDLNGDNIIDGRDRMYDGYPNRPEYVFGSNWKFGYKGFNLALNWVAATNVSRVWNADYRIPFTNSGHRGLLQYFADGCWIDNDNPWAPGREDGTLPRFTKTNYPWNSMDSTLWTVDASYIRLKSASFGYTFSRNKFFDKLGISSLNIMFTGYNLLTFSKMKLQDPEAKSSSSSGNYPLVKTFNVALNITF
ncbi:MAG: TonB-dependent receptor [Candidatus Cryptobacteroides sp.]|nr:TonB-dependent receptor [Candidatus Cryptobacteroides sp.]